MSNEEVMNLMVEMGLHKGGMDNWVMDNAWVAFANRVAAAEREAVLDTIDEFIGAERERHPMFSEGYDHALLHLKEFVNGRGQS